MRTIWTKEQREILKKAAAVLMSRGWLQNVLYKTDPRKGPVCLIGAIHAVVNGDGNADWPKSHSPEMTMVDGIRSNLTNRLRVNPVQWNNAEGRRKTEVVGLLQGIAR